MAQINLGYVIDQLRRARKAAVQGQASPERIQRWLGILDRMADGSLQIGSQAPITGVPAWVTPRVHHGGFASGELAAEGPLTLPERARLERHGLPRDQGVLPLNLHYLSPAGQDELLERARDGAIRMRFPEQGALLAVAWLERAGKDEAARDVRDALLPFLTRLRFYPDEGTHLAPSATVRRHTSAQAAADLEGRLEHDGVEVMRETISVWRPLAERLVEHALVADGRTSEPWLAGAKDLVADYEAAAARHLRARRHHRPKETVGALVTLFRAAADGPLDPSQHRRMIQVAARWCVRHGEPGSPRRAERREREEFSVAASSHARLAAVLASRLRAQAPERGVEDPDALCLPVTAAEAEAHGTRPGEPIPPSLQRPLCLATEASLETLVGSGVLPSLDAVADVLPQLTAPLTASAWEDPVCRTLIEHTVLAFERRRSLLLLNLERQVRVEDLPWVAALRKHRPGVSAAGSAPDGAPDGASGGAPDGASGGATAGILDRVAGLMVEHFPERSMPNPLVSVFANLTRGEPAELWPWTEELAADIFMGSFSAKFVLAAERAGSLLSDSVYARYYGIDYGMLRRKGSGADFATYTGRLASPGTRHPHQWTTAANGRWIEVAQAVTTHNMALLFDSHDRLARFRSRFGAAARAALNEAVGELSSDGGTVPMRLRSDRMAALAWRQGLFYLTFLDQAEQEDIVAELRAEVGQWEAFAPIRLGPLRQELNVLNGCIRGGKPSLDHVPFFGWS